MAPAYRSAKHRKLVATGVLVVTSLLLGFAFFLAGVLWHAHLTAR